jgi:hypothetical protein
MGLLQFNRSMNSVILVSTLHDPPFALKQIYEEIGSSIKKFFKKGVICYTPTTSADFVQILEKEGLQVISGVNLNHVDIYRRAINAGLDSIVNNREARLFYIDFDRLLHWCKNFPTELSKILSEMNKMDLLMLARTKRAFETHPATQRETEIIVNELGSKVLGLSETRDLISFCWGLSYDLGKKLLTIKNSTLTGFYLTWPILLWKWASTKAYLETEGLEWETPDRFLSEIQKLGYDIWLKNFENPGEWNKRVKILHDCIDELSNIISLKVLSI